MRHQAVEIEIDPHFQALRRDHHERPGLVASLGAGAEGSELALHLSAGNIARAADQQGALERGALGLLQPREDRARQVDPVDDHADGRRGHAVAAQALREQARRARERSCRVRTADRLLKADRLGGRDTLAKDRMGFVFRLNPEWPLVVAPGRGGEHHDVDRCASEFAHRLQRVPERLGQMGLVEQDQAVLAEQAGVYGSHPVGDAVAAEQQPRAHLVNGGAEDGRLRRRAHPVMFQRCAAAQPHRVERILALAGEALQTPGHLLDDIAPGRREP